MQPILHTAPDPVVNKRNPHELHWRAEPPEWQGQIEFSYEFYYQQLADKVSEAIYWNEYVYHPSPTYHGCWDQVQVQKNLFILEIHRIINKIVYT